MSARRELLPALAAVVALVVAFAWWLADGSSDPGAPPVAPRAVTDGSSPSVERAPDRVELAADGGAVPEALTVAAQRPPDAPADSASGVVVRGRVRAAGVDRADARVHLVPCGDVLRDLGLFRAQLAWFSRLPSTTTGPTGEFALRVDGSLLQRDEDAKDVCLRFAHVVVSVAGFAPAVRRCLEPRDGVLDVGVIDLAPAPSLLGRVLACDGTPAADVHVGFDQRHRPRHPDGRLCTDAFAPLRATRTGADGRFALVVRAPGDGDFWFHRPGLGVSPRVRYELTSGPLDLGDVVFPCEGELAGRVLDHEGRPVERARLLVSSAAPTRELAADDGHERAVLQFREQARETASALVLHSDQDGRFVFHRMEPGRGYELFVLAEGMEGRSVAQVTAGQDVEVVLQPLDARPVRVFDALSGDALATAEVKAERLFGPRERSVPLEVERDPGDATLHVVRGVGNGRLWLHADAPGFAPLRTLFDAATVDAEPWELVLTPAVGLRGRILGADGELVPDAIVQLVPQAGDAPGTKREAIRVTAPGGAFEIATLAPGAWELRADAPRFVSGRLPVEVGTEGAQDVELVLERPGRFEGRVLGRDAVASQPLRMEARHAQRGDVRSWRSEPDGSFARAGLAPGTWVVSGDRSAPVEVEVRAGETSWVELTWRPRGRLVGEVVGAGLIPDGSLVYAVDPPGEGWGGIRGATHIAPDGRWELELNAGEYVVQAYVAGSGRVVAGPFEVADGDVIPVTLTVAGESLGGRVVDGLTGAPVEGAQVTARLTSDPRHAMLISNGNPGAPGFWPLSDGDGRYRLEHLVAGVHEVVVTAPGYARARLEAVTVPGDAGVTRLVRDAQLKGTVTVRPAGLTAVDGTRVRLLDELGEHVSWCSTSRGAFRFKGIRPGRYRLAVGEAEPIWEGLVTSGVIEVVDLRIDG